MVLALQTHRYLMALLVLIAGLLFMAYLFLTNHLALQGYYLSQNTANQGDLIESLNRLDIKIAKVQTRQYVGKYVKQKELDLAVYTNKQFVVVPSRYTAYEENNVDRLQ